MATKELLTERQVANREAGHRLSVQPEHMSAHRSKHPFHLVVHTLVQRQPHSQYRWCGCWCWCWC
jgi:hypothetical protein